MADRLTQLQDTVNQVSKRFRFVRTMSNFPLFTASGTLLQQHRYTATVLGSEQIPGLRTDGFPDASAKPTGRLRATLLHIDLAMRQGHRHANWISAQRGKFHRTAGAGPEAAGNRKSGTSGKARRSGPERGTSAREDPGGPEWYRAIPARYAVFVVAQKAMTLSHNSNSFRQWTDGTVFRSANCRCSHWYYRYT